MEENMRIRVKCCVSAILLLLMFSAVTVMIPANSYGENFSGEGTRSVTYPQPKIYINGDWNVTTDTVRTNETIILSGNLTVSDNATLIFRNVTLIMNCTASAQWKIDIRNGSTFRILDLDNDNTTTADASVLNSSDPSYNFLFLVREQANFEMRNSEIHNCGGGYIAWQWNPPAPNGAWYGMCILTDNATIDHNLISYNNDGIVLYGSDATVSNNTITWNDVGVYAGYWSNGTIENNWITWSNTYGIWVTGGGTTNTKPSNPTIMGNVITDSGRGNPGGVGIQITYSCRPLIKDTIIQRCTEDALYSYHSWPTMINVTLANSGHGFVLTSAGGYIYLTNCTVRSISTNDLELAGAYAVLTNVSLNRSKILISSYGNYTIRWYLHVYVEDSNHQPIPAAEVRIRDNENGTYDRNFTTDLDGYVKWIIIREYWKNESSEIYYTPYNLTVNYTGLTFLNNPRNSTINESKTEIFIATTPVPEFDSIFIPLIITITVCILFINHQKTKRRKEHEKRK